VRSWIRRLEHSAREETIEIPQEDGTVKRFPQSAAKDALVNLVDRMGAGEDAPPEHPMIAAVRNSSEPQGAQSFYAANSEDWTDPIEDLSEDLSG